MLRNNRPMRGALQVASATCRGPGQWRDRGVACRPHCCGLLAQPLCSAPPSSPPGGRRCRWGVAKR